MTGGQWTLERRSLDDPVVAGMVAEYTAELGTVMPGYDPSRAAPPALEDFRWPNGTFVVVLEGSEAVGCGALRRLSETAGELRRMWVRPAWRGRGVGRLLLEALEQVAREMGLVELCLDTNRVLSAAEALYRSSGYVEVADYNGNEFADCWMKKVLSS